MKAYAIFDGGGVKGAALAGCLASAQEQGIDFIGYGGTSAGSMVALFAAVGYTGRELERILVDELDFRSLLDDGGRQLAEAQGEIEQVLAALQGGWRWDFQHLRAAWRAAGLARKYGGALGLYAGEKLKAFLLDRIGQKRPELKGHADVTFEHLERAGCLPLKVVASDITARKPAVFSREQTEYGASVLEAVRASTSYPFAFQPILRNGRRLVDGGLASNLPAFLFDNEYRLNRVPAFAFDLIAPAGAPPAAYQAGHFYGDLLTTALEASDELLRRVLRGVHYVPVPTPAGINTLDFGLTRQDRQKLFDAGYQATGSFLANFKPLQRVKMAGEKLQQQLWAEYGDQKTFIPVLWALARKIEEDTKAKNVRAHIMLPTGRGTRIVVYHYGMDGEADSDLELGEGAGCSGQAWVNPVADLVKAALDPEPWGMTRAQHAKVSPSRCSMLSVPILPNLVPGEAVPAPRGTLSVDSTTPLEKTEWIDTSGSAAVARQEVVSIMVSWAHIAYRLLS